MIIGINLQINGPFYSILPSHCISVPILRKISNTTYGMIKFGFISGAFMLNNIMLYYIVLHYVISYYNIIY